MHVAYLDKPFEDYWVRSVPAKVRSSIRGARRHLERAGITITAGNTPELVRAFYDSYLEWIDGAPGSGRSRWPWPVAGRGSASAELRARS